jgi:acyl carrier protein
MDATSVVIETIAKVAKRQVGEIALPQKLAEDLGMKSVSRIELAALLEDLLGVPIDNFEIRKPKTVAEVIEMVKAKM